METPALHELANVQSVLAWIVLITGLLATGFALFFLLIIRYSFFKGFGYTLIATGLLQLITGGCALSNPIEPPASGGAALSAGSFLLAVDVFYLGSLLCLAVGLPLFLLFSLKRNLPFWRGMALGLLIQGALCSALLAVEKPTLTQYKEAIAQSKSA